MQNANVQAEANVYRIETSLVPYHSSNHHDFKAPKNEERSTAEDFGMDTCEPCAAMIIDDGHSSCVADEKAIIEMTPSSEKMGDSETIIYGHYTEPKQDI